MQDWLGTTAIEKYRGGIAQDNGLFKYAYDPRGNLTQTTENNVPVQAYIYDATNLMVAAHDPQKGNATYSYNGFRNRVSMSTMPQSAFPTPQTTHYTLDQTRPYHNLLAITGGHNQTFTWGNTLLSTTGQVPQELASPAASAIPGLARDPLATTYYLQDHLGSPIRLLHNDPANPSGQGLAYDEFGVPEVAPDVNTDNFRNALHNPFTFTGYQHDPISNLQYAQARYYNPTTARFAAEDTAKDGQN